MSYKERMVYHFECMNVRLVPYLAEYYNCTVEETKLNVHLKEDQDIVQKLSETVFFRLV